MARLQGFVVDVAGAPIRGVSVAFTGTATGQVEKVASNADGQYTTGQLKAGEYTWNAVVDGFLPASGDFGVPSTNKTIDGPKIVLSRPGTLSGSVFNELGNGLDGVPVLAVQTELQISRRLTTIIDGAYRFTDLPVGPYLVIVDAPLGFVQPSFRTAKVVPGQNTSKIDFVLKRGVATGSATAPPTTPAPTPTVPTPPTPSPTLPTGPTGPVLPSSSPTNGSTGTSSPIGPIESFFARLDSPDFSILARVSEPEAEQAITLFSVVNMLLAGKSHQIVGRERKIDVLGVLTLYYGMQDRSLASKLLVNSQQLFQDIDASLKKLRDDLDRLGSDVDFLEREAKRQFNLGPNKMVSGNTGFQPLFKRYVDIAVDPLLFLDLAAEHQSPYSDKEQIARAFDLLRELKDVILGVVRSLSRYGSIATSQVNANWADFEARAMAVLVRVAHARLTDDVDLARPLPVLADLTGKDLENEIDPYVALAREGGTMLELALETYRAAKDALDDYDEQTLLKLFQAPGSLFLTTRMRQSASVVRQFGPVGWA